MRLTLSVAAAMLLVAVPAHAQIQNKSLKLNQPGQQLQYLLVGDQTGLDPTSFTIEAWIYPITSAGYPTIVGNDFQNGFWFGIDQPTGKLRFWPQGSDQGVVLVGKTVIPLNEWTHVAASYDEASHTARLFINGQQDTSNAAYAGAADASLAPLCIGADLPSNGAANFYWRGWIDEVKVWNEELFFYQLLSQRHHRAGTPLLQYGGIYSALVGYWDMEDPIAGVYQDRWAGFGEAANNASPINGSSLSSSVVPPIAYNHGLWMGGYDFVHRDLPPGFHFEDGLTIEAWIAPWGGPPEAPDGIILDYRTIVGRYFPESFWFGLTPINQLRFYPTGGLGEYFETNASVPNDRWTHVAAVYRPGLAELYINGVREAFSTDFTGLIQDNLLEPLIGADPAPVLGARDPGGDRALVPDGIPEQYLFYGWMDEVRVTGAALSATQLREGMFRSTPAVEMVENELGDPHVRLTASLDPRAPEHIFTASGARFERSGAPLFGPDADLATGMVEGYRNQISPSTGGGLLPGGATLNYAELDLDVPQAFNVNDVNVFVSMSSTSVPEFSPSSLSGCFIQVENPLLTNVVLMTYGDGGGRDLQTVFDDESPNTFVSSVAPYVDGLQPNGALSDFDGTAAMGTWQLSVNGGKGTSDICVWAWGLSFNDIPLDAGDPRSHSFGLRLAGANPVRDHGALEFTLPAADDVTLRLIDVSGREVRRLLRGRFEAGEHRVAWSARDLLAGTYFLRLERADGDARQAKVTVVP